MAFRRAARASGSVPAPKRDTHGWLFRHTTSLLMASVLGLATGWKDFKCSNPFENEKDTIARKAEGAARIRGRYDCQQESMTGQLPGRCPPRILGTSVCLDKSGNLVSERPTNGGRIQLEQEDEWTFSHSEERRSSSGSVSFTLEPDRKVTLREDVRRPGWGTFSVTYQCKYLSPCWNELAPSKTPSVRGIFMRPCEGDLYKSFETHETNVGGGTVAKVCQDLKDSGVTDAFIPFRVDDAVHSHCGQHGELLYASEKYGRHMNPKFKSSIEKGFDPIKALMDACKKAYKKAGKTIRFHAWFPAFNDPLIIADLKAQGSDAGQAAKPPGWSCSPAPSVQSKQFADPDYLGVSGYELSVLEEIVAKYPVAGINLDYIRYAGSGEGDIPSGYEVQVKPDIIAHFVQRVKERFPKLTISADVKATENARKRFGQDGILNILDLIMPMAYTGPGFGGPKEVTQHVLSLKERSLRGLIIPDLRGWAIHEDSAGLLSDLRADIDAAKVGGAGGYAIFTYEALLFDAGTKRLKDIKDKLGY